MRKQLQKNIQSTILSLFKKSRNQKQTKSYLQLPIARNYSKYSNFDRFNSLSMKSMRGISKMNFCKTDVGSQTADPPIDEFYNEDSSKNQDSESNEKTKEDSNENPEEEEFYDENMEDDVDEDHWTSRLPWKNLIIVGLIMGVYNYYKYVVNKHIEDFSLSYLFKKHLSFIYKPSINKFLADELPLHPAIKPKTLIISFENMLYNKDYEAGNGIMLNLRPGLIQFMKDIAQYYEVVLFSDEDSNFMEEVISTIDPKQSLFKYSFGREFYTLHGGFYLKDYNYINRNFSNVVIVDFNEESSFNHKENLVLLNRYNGEQFDNSLHNLKKFLIHCHKNPDVREIIKEFGGLNAIDNYKDVMIEKRQKYESKKNTFNKMFGKRS